MTRALNIRTAALLAFGLTILGAAGTSAAPAAPAAPAAASGVEVSPSVAHATSRRVRDLPQVASSDESKRAHPLRLLPGSAAAGPTQAVQSIATTPAVGTTAGFAGVGNGDYGFIPAAAPPDTNGAVGATQYVQWVNESFAVFNKSTHAITGPFAGNSLFANLGGGCAANNDGDPIAQYDKLAGRWVLTQVSVSNPATNHYLECVAVSQTEDATGAYNLYAFDYGTADFNDYPKLGIWPDAYYTTYNIFTNGSTFAGSKLCAFDRAMMLAGKSATQQCVQLSTSYGGVLPADLDGTNPPPVGSPEYFLNFGSNSLNYWTMHVDFVNPLNTSLSGPVNLPVTAFAIACNGGTCIPEPKGRLDSLADRLMYRLAYRQFADGHGAIVVNHSVQTSNAASGVRWYELRINGSSPPFIYQQGTYSPDRTSRWMGSVAMDKVGNLAVGYSASSSSVFPSIRYASRVPADTLGNLRGETVLKSGGGSQRGFGLTRWGDYSSMSVDPVDDCTLWYTTEYEKTTGAFQWSTWISTIKLPGCP